MPITELLTIYKHALQSKDYVISRLARSKLLARGMSHAELGAIASRYSR